jgi:hypothetical protein
MLAAMSRDGVRTSPQAPHVRDTEAEKVLAVDLGMTALADARAQGMLQSSEAHRLALQEFRAVRQARARPPCLIPAIGRRGLSKPDVFMLR